nr:putative ribonuclease H-like domain-containing protein [Tanacetum cinerariifolium]
NGNSFKPVAHITTNDAGTSTTHIPGHVTTEEKAQKKNDVKARCMLLMELPNEHLMTFNQYKDAKSLFTAIKQDLVIVEQEVKGTTSSNSGSQNMAFVSYPSTNSTNEVPTAYEVSTASTQPSTASTQVNTASSQTSTTNLSDATIPPPPTGLFSPLKLDLSNFGLEEFKQSDFQSYGPKSCETESKNACKYIRNELKESPNAPLVTDRVSDNKDCILESLVVVEKKTVVPTVTKVEFIRPKQQEKLVKKPVKYAEMYRPRAVNTARPNSVVVNAVRENQATCHISLILRNLIEDMLHLGEEQMVEELLVKELLKLDETLGILKKFITEIENLVDKKVKVIRCDNGTEFKNSVMNDFFLMKGIRREFSIARTPQQNGVAERRNRTLIEAARTMLVDSKLPTTFLAEVVNTACYVQNMALVVKPHNNTLYEMESES